MTLIIYQESVSSRFLFIICKVGFRHIKLTRILTRTVGAKGIDMALIQELRYRGGCIRGLNIPGYTLFSLNGIDRPRACILTRNETAWMLPGFSFRDLVAVLIKYNEEWGRAALGHMLCIPAL